MNENVVTPFEGANTEIYVAGEPRLYGWVYHYAGDVFFILVDHLLHRVGAALDVLPRLARRAASDDHRPDRGVLGPRLHPSDRPGARPADAGDAVPHHRARRQPRHPDARSLLRGVREVAAGTSDAPSSPSFAELFVPTFSGITTDAFGVLVILLVPVVMLQKLAITASWWILAITVSEMLLNPIVYYYLKRARARAGRAARARRLPQAASSASPTDLLTPTGKTVTMVVLARRSPLVGALLHARPHHRRSDVGLAAALGRLAVQRLAHADPGQVRRRRAADRRRRGLRPDAMKDPQALRTMEKFQRYLERDPTSATASRSPTSSAPSTRVFHELEPKWGVIPNSWVDIGGLFFIFFSGSPPTETAKYVDPSYTTAHVTFFCQEPQGRQHPPHHRALQGVHRGQPDGEGGVQARRRPDRRARGGQRGAGAQRPPDELPRLLHDLRDHAVHLPLVGGGLYLLGAADPLEHHGQRLHGGERHRREHPHAAAGDRRRRLRHRLRPLHRQPHHRGDPRARRSRRVGARGAGDLRQGGDLHRRHHGHQHRVLDHLEHPLQRRDGPAARDLDGRQLRRLADAAAGADLVLQAELHHARGRQDGAEAGRPRRPPPRRRARRATWDSGNRSSSSTLFSDRGHRRRRDHPRPAARARESRARH